jgi:acyl-CoA thioesterase II
MTSQDDDPKRAEPLCPVWNGSDVAELLSLTRSGDGRFRSPCNERNENGRIYGGQMLGQALMAAALTAPADRPASYLQFLFVAGGAPEQPIDYAVTTLQEGKRFSSRNVRGEQSGARVVCDAGVSFALPIEAPARQTAPPVDCGLGLDPETLMRLEDVDAPRAREVEAVLSYALRPHGTIDFRAPFVDDLLGEEAREPRMRFFIRIRRRLADDARLHAAAFAYLSDYWINFVACIPHVQAAAQTRTRLYVASLNHAIWLHRPLRADDWLLFDCRNPSGAFGRGLSIARVYDLTGDLVASAAQECLLAPVN